MPRHSLRNGGNGYEWHFETISGKTLFEADLQQCPHCQFTWKYKAGSGILRGWCWRCGVSTCGRKACDTHYFKEQWADDLEAVERHNRKSIEAGIRLQEWRERLVVGGTRPD